MQQTMLYFMQKIGEPKAVNVGGLPTITAIISFNCMVAIFARDHSGTNYLSNSD